MSSGPSFKDPQFIAEKRVLALGVGSLPFCRAFGWAQGPPCLPLFLTSCHSWERGSWQWTFFVYLWHSVLWRFLTLKPVLQLEERGKWAKVPLEHVWMDVDWAVMAQGLWACPGSPPGALIPQPVFLPELLSQSGLPILVYPSGFQGLQR